MSGEVVLRRSRGNVRGSRFGFVARVQAAVSEALTACGQDGIGADGIFGPNSRKAVQRLAACQGFADLELGPGQTHDGVVTTGLWRRLFRDELIPTVHERALALWLTHEATDYDVVEFNFVGDGDVQRNDRGSFLTWGPFGATVGHGGEVQTILKRPEVNAFIDECFGAEGAPIRALTVTTDQDDLREQVRSAFRDLNRRNAWEAGFRCLAMRPQVRANYDDAAFGTGSTWLVPPLRSLRTLVPDGTSQIDFAFFVDLAMHVFVSPARINLARQSIERREVELGRRLKPTERRREIGQSFVSQLQNQVEDRRGRNVMFYIDGLEETGLTDREVTTWRNRSGVRASDVGLSDEPHVLPGLT